MKKNPLRPFDIPVIAVSIVLTLAVAGAVFSGAESASRVIVKGPDNTWVYPLDAEETIAVSGLLGETIIELHGGSAVFVSSPCEGQSCVASGKLSKNGQWSACLPNKVFVLVEGQESGASIDAAAW